MGDEVESAEPLERNFSRVLSQNLSAQLGTQDIYTFPWFTSVPTGKSGLSASIRSDWGIRHPPSEPGAASSEPAKRPRGAPTR